MRLAALWPLLQVESVPRSIAFYARLGFDVKNVHVPEGEREPSWAWLAGGDAHVMVGRGDEHTRGAAPSVLLYLYCDDLDAYRAALLSAGLEPGPIAFPPYAPGGEFRIVDPDGYAIMVTHT